MACDWIHSYTLIPTAMTVCSSLSQLGENHKTSFKRRAAIQLPVHRHVLLMFSDSLQLHSLYTIEH